ncbi:Uncharacterized protein OBRU01_11168 [Operophtera brumata]|uniref:Uncharacterized protein n=1 Tax=Operophtera brumata TaxID=104452 RepID=A0A0L7LCG8_OPEBR|nr:Uncharacterized protein OBRU01_11168 [Operophtera brumata]
MAKKMNLSLTEEERMTAEYQPVTPPELVGWTKDEHFDLNIGLKLHGYNLKELQKRVPDKTEEQIQAVIDYFKGELKKKAEHTPSNRQRRKIKQMPQVPLAKWADLMTDKYDYKDLQTECATAVRIIADFEDFPHPSSSGNIDFRKIYNYIADAMEGKPLPDDPVAADVFNHCIMEASAMSKAFIPKNELQETLGHIGNDCKVDIPRPTKDGGLAALRHLAAQKNYNPLNVPEKYLMHAPLYTNDI